MLRKDEATEATLDAGGGRGYAWRVALSLG